MASCMHAAPAASLSELRLASGRPAAVPSLSPALAQTSIVAAAAAGSKVHPRCSSWRQMQQRQRCRRVRANAPAALPPGVESAAVEGASGGLLGGLQGVLGHHAALYVLELLLAGAAAYAAAAWPTRPRGWAFKELVMVGAAMGATRLAGLRPLRCPSACHMPGRCPHARHMPGRCPRAHQGPALALLRPRCLAAGGAHAGCAIPGGGHRPVCCCHDPWGHGDRQLPGPAAIGGRDGGQVRGGAWGAGLRLQVRPGCAAACNAVRCCAAAVLCWGAGRGVALGREALGRGHRRG